jgi:hypothetical protein
MSFNDVLNSSIEVKIIKNDSNSDTKTDKSKKEKSTIIQIKIPTLVNALSTNKPIEPEKADDKVNIVIKSCKNITSKQALLIIPITKFFSNRDMLNKIITILKGESISLRLIDWFVTNYCKKFNILYNLNDFKGDQPNKSKDELQSFDNFIIIHNNYKGQLKAYSKKNFDPFCRRNRIRFYYEDNKYFITTVGQLNFFKWALENYIIDYIENHIKSIDADMNLRCETVKKTGTKINPSSILNSQSNLQNNLQISQLDDMPLPIQMPPIITITPISTNINSATSANASANANASTNTNTSFTKKKKPQEGIIVVETQIKTQIKPKGGSTRKKRKEISTAASKSLSIHNYPTTLIFD